MLNNIMNIFWLFFLGTEDCDDNESSVEKNPDNVVSAANYILSFYEQNNLLSPSDLAAIRKAKVSAMKLVI